MPSALPAEKLDAPTRPDPMELHLLVSEQAESQALVPVTRRQVVSAGLQLPKLHSSGALGKHRWVQLPELTHQKASGSPQVLGFLRWPQTTQCF